MLFEVVRQNAAHKYKQQLANAEAAADATGVTMPWTLARVRTLWTTWERALPVESRRIEGREGQRNREDSLERSGRSRMNDWSGNNVRDGRDSRENSRDRDRNRDFGGGFSGGNRENSRDRERNRDFGGGFTGGNREGNREREGPRDRAEFSA